MSEQTTKIAGRATLADLQTLAAKGVERALAARMTELSQDQVQSVSGGATAGPVILRGPIINGIINPEIFKNVLQGANTLPEINTGALQQRF